MLSSGESLCLRDRLVAAVIITVVALFGLGFLVPQSVGAEPEENLLPGPFPSDITEQDGVTHMRMVTERADVEGVVSEDLWIDVSGGDFKLVEREGFDITSVCVCAGTQFKKYDVSSHLAGDFTLAAVMVAEPDAVTGPRGALEALSRWTVNTVERASGAGTPLTVRGRSALLYTGIGRGAPGSGTGQASGYATSRSSGQVLGQASELDLLVDVATGLPLQVEVRGADGGSLSNTVYYYETTRSLGGGFTLSFPKGYHVQTDDDLDLPGNSDVPARELAHSMQHDMYWAGEEFGSRPLTRCRVGDSGVITLQYGQHSGAAEKPGSSPLLSVYEYVAGELGPETLSNIAGQLRNPTQVQGQRGTYTLYETALNGMPMLGVALGDVCVLIADVEDGDVDVMVQAADALVRVTD